MTFFFFKWGKRENGTRCNNVVDVGVYSPGVFFSPVRGPEYVRYLDKITHVALPSEPRLPPFPLVSPRIHRGATGEEYPDPRAEARPYKVSIESRAAHVASDPGRLSLMNPSS